MTGVRTFTVISPCPLEGRQFMASIPVRAARKAFTVLCRNDSNQTHATILIRESTPFRKEREYCYILTRERLENPITIHSKNLFRVNFKTTVRSIEIPTQLEK